MGDNTFPFIPSDAMGIFFLSRYSTFVAAFTPSTLHTSLHSIQLFNEDMGSKEARNPDRALFVP